MIALEEDDYESVDVLVIKSLTIEKSWVMGNLEFYLCNMRYVPKLKGNGG